MQRNLNFHEEFVLVIESIEITHNSGIWKQPVSLVSCTAFSFILLYNTNFICIWSKILCIFSSVETLLVLGVLLCGLKHF